MVTRTLVQEHAFAFIHADGDVLRLFAQTDHHRAGVVVEADFGAVVTDVLNGVAHDLIEIHHRIGRNLARHDDQTRRAQGFARYPRVWVLG